jgi:cysteine-rich repeat protein
MHLHLVMFQVLDRQAFEVQSGVVVPIGDRQPPSADEAGWKDTVQVPPDRIVRVIARFEDYKGRFPYHCHILEHEDHEMMRQFQTVLCGDGEVDPGETCDDGNQTAGDGCSPSCAVESPARCEEQPTAGCVPAARGLLLVNEKQSGSERLKVVMKGLASALAPPAFGDPVDGSTSQATCVYGQTDELVGELLVDRAGALCDGGPCWDASAQGYRYRDSSAMADGVQVMLMKGGEAGRGRIVIRARNVSGGAMALPTGIAAALAGHTTATAQVLTSNASCFELSMTNVRRADGLLFRALGQ